MQNQQMLGAQSRQRVGTARPICKLNFKGIGRILLHDSPHLPTHRPMLRQVVNQRYYVVLFDSPSHGTIVLLIYSTYLRDSTI